MEVLDCSLCVIWAYSVKKVGPQSPGQEVTARTEDTDTQANRLAPDVKPVRLKTKGPTQAKISCSRNEQLVRSAAIVKEADE